MEGSSSDLAFQVEANELFIGGVESEAGSDVAESHEKVGNES